MKYIAPKWLPGGNLQTIWPALYSRRAFGALPSYHRERWTTPDHDFIDVDWQAGPAEAPLIVQFHGLEGSSASHYAHAFADFARERGCGFVVPHFRGCSGELNLGPRAYHSGDFEEVGWILTRIRQRHSGPVLAIGVSLGGNALLRWAEEMGDQASRVVDAIASVSSPVDLCASGQAIGRGFNRWVYTRMFLNSMKPKALLKLAQHPGLFDAEALGAARDLYQFDNIFTAPLHGFKNVDDYWTRASAKPHLDQIRIPALVVNARNDPFVPDWSLPTPGDAGKWVTLWQPPEGGHVGFPQGAPPGHVRCMPDAVGHWLTNQVSFTHASNREVNTHG
jgi:predicted alpha/beta-fold hydrolase